ncbi:hypothetical protein A3A55_03740 [Candidatus Roizmanbacteria bacterium RIFCSPLOWO2_01_FULL_40_14]|nr:MAG: hypothetical protein A3A55_03740 [Candidatus Roizmanbacteria bacterium RIFCSPLOWO2_01_FULL_40_14]
MSKPPRVVVDSDAIIAQTNPKDELHGEAMTISQRLADLNAFLIYPATTIAESATHMQRVLNSTASAIGTIQYMIEPTVFVAEVNQQTLKSARNYMNPRSSKKNTIFDAIVATVAEKYDADAIFSFDKFYKRNGFKLASEL